MKSRASLVLGIARLNVVGILSCNAAISFVEYDPYTGGPNGTVTGTIDGVSVSITVARTNFDGITSTVTNNSLNLGAGYTPSQNNVDEFTFIKNEAQPGSATVVFTFGSPIENPIFHMRGLDRTRWDFSATLGASLTLLSATTVNFQVVGSEVFSSSAPGGNDGSVRFNGTYNTISATLTEEFPNPDGQGIQIPADIVPEPTQATLLLAALSLAGLRRSRRSIFAAL